MTPRIKAREILLRTNTGDLAGPLLTVKRSDRARRLWLRLDPVSGVFVLTLPRRCGVAAAEQFLAAHQGWIAARLAALPAAIPFAVGTVLPVCGRDRVIHHTAGARHAVIDDGVRLSVGGAAVHVPRRVADYLRQLARQRLTEDAAGFAAAAGLKFSALRIGDPKSRWGSCSAAGVLRFSWRLVLAPEDVRRYVAAHEVAHLAELNHGPRFWHVVERLFPDHAPHRAWLKHNGPRLLRYG